MHVYKHILTFTNLAAYFGNFGVQIRLYPTGCVTDKRYGEQPTMVRPVT